MSMEFIAIISASIALASLIVTGQNSLRRECGSSGKKCRSSGKKFRSRARNTVMRFTEVKLEVASLKATVETYFRVRVDPPMQAAVAEGPEDYGAD